MEISEFFCHSDLREISLGKFEIPKMTILDSVELIQQYHNSEPK